MLHPRHSQRLQWMRGGATPSPMAFNVFRDAEDLINDTWVAEVPPYTPDPDNANPPIFRDAPKVTNTVRALAELVYYSKKKVRALQPGEDQWIKDSFAQHHPNEYLPRLRPLLESRFPELIQSLSHTSGNDSDAQENDPPASHWWDLTRPPTQQNYLYISDYKNIPNTPSLETLLRACGIPTDQQPDNHDFLIQAYHRVHVRLDRLIALSHLLIAGAQSETVLNRATLEREYKLQEKLKELKASYLVEHSTMQLAFAKRLYGPQMLEKLNHHTGLEHKHALALESIDNRLSIGTEQYPTLVNATHRLQRIYFGLGQLLLGGFLASEVIKSVSEWSAVYMHRDHYSFFAEMAKLIPGSMITDIETLQHEFHVFEMSSVYLSMASVVSVVGVALYYKLKNRHINHESHKNSGAHH